MFILNKRINLWNEIFTFHLIHFLHFLYSLLILLYTLHFWHIQISSSNSDFEIFPNPTQFAWNHPSLWPGFPHNIIISPSLYGWLHRQYFVSSRVGNLPSLILCLIRFCSLLYEIVKLIWKNHHRRFIHICSFNCR